MNVSQGHLWLIPISQVVTTDASGKGWGAHLGSILVQGTWKDDDELKKIVKLERAEGSRASPQVFQKVTPSPPHSGAVGQLICRGLLKQAGRHQKRSPAGPSNGHFELG